MHFDFATAGRIVFGCGALDRAPALARELGASALVVTGRDTSRCARLVAGLDAGGVRRRVFSVVGEPSLDSVRSGVAAARELGCHLVIGCGGGSAIDAAKAIAALAPNSGEPLDYLEVVGRGGALERTPLPVIAIPTTAGTGSEVTRNAVLYSPEHRVKASLRSPLMLPRIALVDPNLTLELPAAITASTGLDALTQLIEPYVSVRRNPMTDMFCVDGMRRVAASLSRAYHHGDDVQARESMSFASLLGGLALANAGLGAVHGFAAPLGGMFDAPHGSVCAALLPVAMEINVRALRGREPDGDALRRYAHVAEILTGEPGATPERGVAWVRELCAELNIPTLTTYGVTTDAVPELVAKAAKASSMKGNPLPLTDAEMTELVTRAL
jgi:alcohol dehydrogenase class IV